jgi:hypothetical protein
VGSSGEAILPRTICATGWIMHRYLRRELHSSDPDRAHSSAATRVVGKQAVAGFVRGDGQSSGSGNRGVLPVCHGERERRLPRVSGGPYGIDKPAQAADLPITCMPSTC